MNTDDNQIWIKDRNTRFRENILSDFPDKADFVETRLAELIAKGYGQSPAGHVPRDWRWEFLLLAQIRLELEKEKKKGATSDDGAGYTPVHEIPIELDEPDVSADANTMAEHGEQLSIHSQRSKERNAVPAGKTTAGKSAKSSPSR